ncbi:hypothetical protein WICPIJ_002427 [Wickerhamomyces pijperi]|uniref:DNA polymerase delta catalytic subunit n=1 Tax=Wickerhamomyces pijperi TaxID=599730 RepID=A0A9P8TNY6_WICPI|nr:hypothetical protein WICPIJ_002427 [Wickerhamomyces pijperi]
MDKTSSIHCGNDNPFKRPRLPEGVKKVNLSRSNTDESITKAITSLHITSKINKSSFLDSIKHKDFETQLYEISQHPSIKSTSNLSLSRPSIPENFAAETHTLTFQQYESNTYQDPLTRQSYIRLHGVTMQGNSVSCLVSGFNHYLYIESPITFTNAGIQRFAVYLCKQILPELVDLEFVHKKCSVTGKIVKLLKACVHDHTVINNELRERIEKKGLLFPNESDQELAAESWKLYKVQTYDNIQYLFRFLIDKHIKGPSWITLPKGKYTYYKDWEVKQTTCQFEVIVNHEDAVYHNQTEKPWCKLNAPLRIVSFDFETDTYKTQGKSNSEYHRILQISNIVVHSKVNSTEENVPFVRNIFVLDSCDEIKGTDVRSFDTEREMLMAWRQFIEDVDADIITGFNIKLFDFPFLFNRLSVTSDNEESQLYPLGRCKSLSSGLTKEPPTTEGGLSLTSRQLLNLNGRIVIDLFPFCKRQETVKNGKCSLTVCSEKYLGDHKEEFGYKDIHPCQRGDSKTRKRMAVYCVKDSYLTLRIFQITGCLQHYVAKSMDTGVPIHQSAQWQTSLTVNVARRFKKFWESSKEGHVTLNRGVNNRI